MSGLTCPICQGTMKEISRNGVPIDTCTECRGIWLDRGELEKILSAIDDRSRKAFLSAYWEDADPNRRHRYDRHDDGRHGSSQSQERQRFILDFCD